MSEPVWGENAFTCLSKYKWFWVSLFWISLRHGSRLMALTIAPFRVCFLYSHSDHIFAYLIALWIKFITADAGWSLSISAHTWHSFSLELTCFRTTKPKHLARKHKNSNIGVLFFYKYNVKRLYAKKNYVNIFYIWNTQHDS